jgi:hypothetical protein
MDKGLEKFLEVEGAHIHDLDIQVLEVHLQLRLELLVLHVLHMIIFELLRKESILLHALYVIDGLLLHAGNSPELIAIWIFGVQVLLTLWDHSRLIHHLLMGCLLDCELLLDQLVGLFLGDTLLMALLLQDGQCALLPTLEVALVKVEQDLHVGALELVDLLLADHY